MNKTLHYVLFQREIINNIFSEVIQSVEQKGRHVDTLWINTAY